MIRLSSCPKTYSSDQDKAVSPGETVARVKARLAAQGKDVLAETRRIDTGRLDIPVFLSVAGADARAVMPTRKQMGKGASPEQAEASALMELVERYSFFSFFDDPANFTLATMSRARKLWPETAIPPKLIAMAAHDELSDDEVVALLDLMEWRFVSATDITHGREIHIPLDWFKTLGEFNGSSAGNTPEESILQGGCELVERHVCAIVDADNPILPTIDPASLSDPVLRDLHAKFTSQGIRVALKDFSLSMPAPTIGAIAWDPKTFPGVSEIVYTAGTAASPAKAAIRALTEVAQLAGDFETGAVYEASGLTKYERLQDIQWLLAGDLVSLDSLPSIESGDIYDELMALAGGLDAQGYPLLSVDVRQPDIDVPANYNIAPGFRFRERDTHSRVGMFVGRKLAEEARPEQASQGLAAIEAIYGRTFFLPFHQGLLAIRMGDPLGAEELFAEAEPLQPDQEKTAMAAFYRGYSLTQIEDWQGAEEHLARAAELCSEHKEYYNLLGVSRFKQGRYEQAAESFGKALKIDRGSAIDLANLGLCCKFMGKTAEALDYLDSALELDPRLDFARPHLEELQNGVENA